MSSKSQIELIYKNGTKIYIWENNLSTYYIEILYETLSTIVTNKNFDCIPEGVLASEILLVTADLLSDIGRISYSVMLCSDKETDFIQSPTLIVDMGNHTIQIDGDFKPMTFGDFCNGGYEEFLKELRDKDHQYLTWPDYRSENYN
jgi:hypothetical protein